MSRTRWVLVVLLLVAGLAPARASDDADRQRLDTLFGKLQDALLTVNSEIMQYGERLAELSNRLRDRALWQGEEVDRERLLPRVRELNRVKAALALIGTGLEQRYTQVRSFQGELRDRYPALKGEIDGWYASFDKVYESSLMRHRKTVAQMDELKRWLKTQLAAHPLSESDDDEAAPAPPQQVASSRLRVRRIANR